MAKSKWPEVRKKLYLVERWCREGMTEKVMAQRLGIAVSTFEDYKTTHPELAEALKNNKEIADYQVEDSLYDKCVGKFVEVDKAFKCKKVYYDKNGNRCEKEEVIVKKVKEFIPPDTMAIAIWLNNRRPDNWRRNANKEKLDEKKFEHDKNIDGKKYW